MPTTPHAERHFHGGALVRDIVIGMSDGLTVPFALAAGLSGATAGSHLVLTAGFAEIAAGSIAMGLGGYLAAKSDAEHYANEHAREAREVRMVPDLEAQEIEEVFEKYGLTKDETAPVVAALRKRPDAWVDFMMRFELGLEPPEPKRARNSATTIGLAYIAGGLVPLVPYMLVASAERALLGSAATTLLALSVFGWVKGRFTGARPMKSAIQTAIIGAVAASAAFALAKAVG